MNRELLLSGQRITFSVEPNERGVVLRHGSFVHELSVSELAPGKLVIQESRAQIPARVARVRDRIFVWLAGKTFEFQVPASEHDGAGLAAGSLDDVRAPMPGTLIKLLVKEGDAVGDGQVVAVLEAMKMEHQLRAPRSGTVTSIGAAVGAIVDAEAVIISLSPES